MEGNTKLCQHCGQSIAKDAVACPHCGYRAQQPAGAQAAPANNFQALLFKTHPQDA